MITEVDCETLGKLDRVRAIRAIHRAWLHLFSLETAPHLEHDNAKALDELGACMAEAGHKAFTADLLTERSVPVATLNPTVIALLASALRDVLNEEPELSEEARMFAGAALRLATRVEGEAALARFRREEQLREAAPDILNVLRWIVACDPNPDSSAPVSVSRKQIKEARALIARADGQLS